MIRARRVVGHRSEERLWDLLYARLAFARLPLCWSRAARSHGLHRGEDLVHLHSDTCLGRGPIWCAGGSKIHRAAMAAHEIGETCRKGIPVPFSRRAGKRCARGVDRQARRNAAMLSPGYAMTRLGNLADYLAPLWLARLRHRRRTAVRGYRSFDGLADPRRGGIFELPNAGMVESRERRPGTAPSSFDC